MLFCESLLSSPSPNHLPTPVQYMLQLYLLSLSGYAGKNSPPKVHVSPEDHFSLAWTKRLIPIPSLDKKAYSHSQPGQKGLFPFPAWTKRLIPIPSLDKKAYSHSQPEQKGLFPFLACPSIIAKLPIAL